MAAPVPDYYTGFTQADVEAILAVQKGELRHALQKPYIENGKSVTKRAPDAVNLIIAGCPKALKEFDSVTYGTPRAGPDFCAHEALLSYRTLLCGFAPDSFAGGGGPQLAVLLREPWQGIPASRFFDAIFRHSPQAAEGATDEHHIGAIQWNAAGVGVTTAQMEKGTLPADLNDLPYGQAGAKISHLSHKSASSACARRSILDAVRCST